MEQKLNSNQSRVSTVVKAVINHDKQIDSVAQKIKQQELKSMHDNLVVSGIKEDKGEQCTDKIKAFLNDKMKVRNVCVKNAYRVGKYNSDRN